MNYKLQDYKERKSKQYLTSWFKWCVILVGVSILMWIVFELCMLIVGYPSIFN